MREPTERKGTYCDGRLSRHALIVSGRRDKAAMPGTVEARLHHGDDTHRAEKVSSVVSGAHFG
jgi:hypothetical protein